MVKAFRFAKAEMEECSCSSSVLVVFISGRWSEETFWAAGVMLWNIVWENTNHKPRAWLRSINLLYDLSSGQF